MKYVVLKLTPAGRTGLCIEPMAPSLEPQPAVSTASLHLAVLLHPGNTIGLTASYLTNSSEAGNSLSVSQTSQISVHVDKTFLCQDL